MSPLPELASRLVQSSLDLAGPALALRVERSRQRMSNGFADQVAVTLWFREGPALPGPSFGGGGSELGRFAVRVGAGLARAGIGLAGAAALGAATVAANRLDAARQPRRITGRS
jgi:hypothetical protein